MGHVYSRKCPDACHIFEVTLNHFIFTSTDTKNSTLQPTGRQRLAMVNFWDLHKTVRQRTYRLHLVQNDPIDYDSFKQSHCGCNLQEAQLEARFDMTLTKPRWDPKLIPNLLQAARKIDREAAQIYFGENSFVV